jgi:pentatricopeptide repeat protein
VVVPGEFVAWPPLSPAKQENLHTFLLQLLLLMTQFPPISQAFHKLTLVLKSCKKTSEIRQIHCYMIKTSLTNVPFTLSKLLAASILDMDYASTIFSYIQNPNLFMFNTMLRGYSISNFSNKALPIFNEVRNSGIELDQFSFVAVLKACGRSLEVGFGRGVHGIAMKSGNRLFVDVNNTLLQFYCVCRRIEDAHKVFDEFPERNDLVTWNIFSIVNLNFFFCTLEKKTKQRSPFVVTCTSNSFTWFTCLLRFVHFFVWFELLSRLLKEKICVRFTGKNYPVWEFQFRMYVKGKGLWSHLDDVSMAPLETTDLDEWETKDPKIITCGFSVLLILR